MSFIFLSLRSRTSTCNWWSFWLFRRCHRHFLFRENLFGSLRHFEDISKFTFESQGLTQTKITFTQQQHFRGQQGSSFHSPPYTLLRGCQDVPLTDKTSGFCRGWTFSQTTSMGTSGTSKILIFSHLGATRINANRKHIYIGKDSFPNI